MELARIFGKMYQSSKSRPHMRIAFLLSSGGALNYFGTKKWLESHLDQDSQIELLNDVPFVTCLDTLSGSNKLRMHVSKPPKPDSHAGKFLTNLGEDVEIVHKKINLADEMVSQIFSSKLHHRLELFIFNSQIRQIFTKFSLCPYLGKFRSRFEVNDVALHGCYGVPQYDLLSAHSLFILTFLTSLPHVDYLYTVFP